MNTIQPSDFASDEAIARNHERLRLAGDSGRTVQMFASEDLTLRGELLRQVPAAIKVVAAPQMELFA